MAASDLTTLANVKSWLNLTSINDDALLTRLITAVSDAMQQWMNRTIASQTYSETRNGNGKDRMMFYDYPVTAVSLVQINGTNGITVPVSTDYSVPGYWFNEREIMLNGYEFRRGNGNILLQYTAGYSTVPLELEQACIDTVALRYRERDRIGHKSKSLQGETVSFIVADFPDFAMTVMQNYKRVIQTWRGESR